MSTSFLSERLEFLERALDSDKVAPLCYNDIDIMDSSKLPSIEAVQMRLNEMTEIFGQVHTLLIIASEPRLLYLPDAAALSKKIIDKLTRMWPYKGNQQHKRVDVIETLAAYPILLIRMQFYLDDKAYRRIQDLPVDIQNNLLKNYCG